MPDGYDRNSLKKYVRLHKTLKDDERGLLVWVLDQALTYTLTVKQIREEMQWGELRWTKTRASLSGKEILMQTKTPLDRKSHAWTLRFDFVAVIALAQPVLSPIETKASRARVIPDHGQVSPDPCPESCIAPEALAWSGIPPQVKLESPPKGIFDGDEDTVNQKEQHFVFKALLPLGLKKGVTNDLFEILQVSGIEDFLVEFRSARQFARNESGLAIALAKKAARGYYTQTRVENFGPTPLAVCEKYKTHKGELTSPSGLVAVASGFDGGQLRLDATTDAKAAAKANKKVAVGLLLSLSDSAKLWLRLEAAELDFVPSH